MKRVDLIRHLEAHGCRLLREGGSHSVYLNPENRRASTVPRHREVNDFLARKICRVSRSPSRDAYHRMQQTAALRMLAALARYGCGCS